MTRSSYVMAIEAVQKPVTVLLRSEGFKRSGRTYNRTVGDGLIQVVNFQMGQYPIGNHAVPGIRESLYGRFAVNLGVFLPCVSEIEGGEATTKRVVQDYACQIRERLGRLAQGRDIWWSLDDSPDDIGKLIAGYLEAFGLPFLSKYADYSSVLSEYRAHGRLPFRSEGRSALDAAIICHHLGEADSANEFFDRAATYAGEQDGRGFREYVEKIRKRCLTA